MNTKEINLALKPLKCFIGVFSRDNIPRPSKFPAAYIINTDSQYEPGEHWVAIYITRCGKGEYFDPFGLPPLHPDMIGLMKKIAKDWIYSGKDIQNIKSTKCGHFCVYFIRHRAKGQSLAKIIKKFSIASSSNDRVVKNYK